MAAKSWIFLVLTVIMSTNSVPVASPETTPLHSCQHYLDPILEISSCYFFLVIVSVLEYWCPSNPIPLVHSKLETSSTATSFHYS